MEKRVERIETRSPPLVLCTALPASACLPGSIRVRRDRMWPGAAAGWLGSLLTPRSCDASQARCSSPTSREKHRALARRFAISGECHHVHRLTPNRQMGNVEIRSCWNNGLLAPFPPPPPSLFPLRAASTFRNPGLFAFSWGLARGATAVTKGQEPPKMPRFASPES